MHVQSSTNSIEHAARRQQIGLLVSQNESHLLNKYAGEGDLLKREASAGLSEYITKQISVPDAVAEWAFDEGRDLTTGLVVGRPALWDSRVFGETIGKIVLALFEPEMSSAHRGRILRRVLDRLKARMVSARISLKDLKTIQALESEGALTTDVLLTYRADPSKLPALAESDFKVGPALESDEPALKLLGGSIFTMDRFHGDCRLPFAKSNEAYETWVSNSLHGFADVTLVARHRTEPIGFITCKTDWIGSSFKLGVIDLVGVNPSYWGQGVGRLLVVHALQWFTRIANARLVYVGTQASNSHAIRMYEKAGFSHVNSEATMHLWAD